jgi:hypothetical protein
MLQVTLHSIQNASPQGQAFAARAATLLQSIVNDPRFLAQARNLRFTYTERMDDSGEDVPSTDNETIVQIISGGKEVMEVPDGVIKLEVVLRKFSWFYRNTMGAVTPPDHTIYTNRRFFERWLEQDDVVSAAAHWMHEWMHVAGFYHETDSGDSNDVPYAIGELAVSLGEGLAGKSSNKSFRKAEPGADYLKAAHDEHACVVTRAGAPADLFDDSEDPDDDVQPT